MPSLLIENERVGTNKSIAAYLKSQLDSRRDIFIDEADEDRNAFTAISYDGEEETACALAGCLADYIVRYREEALLRRIIEKNYCYFTAREREEILSSALLNVQIFKSRKQAISRGIYAYLESNQVLSITGFINFRLREYYHELEYVVDTAVEEFMAHKEYEEFLDLLKFFVNIQEERIDQIHILCLQNGYKLYDKSRDEITNRCYMEFFKEFPYSTINPDDFLISTLVNLAPVKVILHHVEQMRNPELLQTIERVFENAVERCDSCSICRLAESTETYAKKLPDKVGPPNPLDLHFQ